MSAVLERRRPAVPRKPTPAAGADHAKRDMLPAGRLDDPIKQSFCMIKPSKVLISGAFNDEKYKFGFFERIASALEREGIKVERFNSYAFNRPNSAWGKFLERLITLPARIFGINKQRVRAALPWTPDGQRERSLLERVRLFRPDMLIVIRGFGHRPKTLEQCRKLGVKNLVGWYVEGPLEPGKPEAESLLYDRFYCIHTEVESDARQRIIHLPSYGLDRESFSRLRWPRNPKRKIVFVGTPTERRIRYLEELRDLPLELWGPRWSKVKTLAHFCRGEFIWGPQLNELYNDSAIVLNIASWDSNLSGMTQRIFEIPASGAFMLTDDASEVREVLLPGVEIDVFDSPADLRRQCERYLAETTIRENVADGGYRRAMRQADFAVTAKRLVGLVS